MAEWRCTPALSLDAPPAGGQDVAEAPIASAGDQFGCCYLPDAHKLIEREQAIAPVALLPLTCLPRAA